MLGIIFAVISSIFFGLYIIPRKISKLPAIQFSTLMAFGFTLGSALLYLLQVLLKNNEPLNDSGLLFAIIAGILWASAFVLFVKSIDTIGLARSNQWKNLQGPVGVILALVVLREANSVNPWLAILSGLAIFCSALLFSIRSSKNEIISKKGIALAVLSGVIFGVIAIINKYVTETVGVYSQLVIWSLSILISLVIFQLLTKTWSNTILKLNKESLLGITSGLLYLGASAFMLLSLSKIETSIAFTIIQMNFLIVVLLGIFVFKEFSFRGNQIRILFGLILATFGVILLSLAR